MSNASPALFSFTHRLSSTVRARPVARVGPGLLGLTKCAESPATTRSWSMHKTSSHGPLLSSSTVPSPSWSKTSFRLLHTSPSLLKRGSRIPATNSGAALTPLGQRTKVPFGAQSRESLRKIFGQEDVPYEDGNKILRILHQRRVIGSLVDKGVHVAGNHNVRSKSLLNALKWLREKFPVDEQAAAEIWAEQEAERLEGTYIARAEKMGLYKPLEEDEKKEISTKSVYGVSVIDEFKKFHEDRRAREAKEKEESGETQKTQELALAKREERESKQMVFQQKIAERRAKRALQGMVTPDEVPVPEMSSGQRLLASTAFGLGLVALLWLAGTTYTPPTQEQRLFPDVPTAVATIGSIVAVNLVFWAMWHMPVMWRRLNRYMVQAAAAPYWPSVFGNIFSHQNIPHLAANMFGLFFYGVTLHEDIGRGNFVALYLSGGVVGSLFSLWYHVLTKSMSYYTFGASGAVWATMVGWGVLNLSKPQAPTDSWYFAADVARWGGIVFQFLAHFAPGVFSKIDVMSHLGGALVGGTSAWWLKQKAARGRSDDAKPAQSSPEAAPGIEGPKAT